MLKINQQRNVALNQTHLYKSCVSADLRLESSWNKAVNFQHIGLVKVNQKMAVFGFKIVRVESPLWSSPNKKKQFGIHRTVL